MLLIIYSQNSTFGPEIGAVAQADTHDEAIEKGVKMTVNKLNDFRGEEVSDKEKETIKKEFETHNEFSPNPGDYYNEKCWSVSIATVDTL